MPFGNNLLVETGAIRQILASIETHPGDRELQYTALYSLAEVAAGSAAIQSSIIAHGAAFARGPTVTVF
jgi:hypothetical protein